MLDLSFNKIASIPASIENMCKLKYFYVEYNCITTIPRSILKLKDCLVGLRIEHNLLEFLPTEIASLEKLKVLGLEGNPLNTMPLEIRSKAHSGSIKKVQVYLEQLEGGSKSFNRVKLMFVGEGGVGKSTLLSCFRLEKLDQGEHEEDKRKKRTKNEPNIATDGIEIINVKWNK